MRSIGSSVAMLLGLVCACRAEEPREVEIREVQRSEPAKPSEPARPPEPAPPPEPPPSSEATPPATLAELVVDVALVSHAQLICADGTQCFGAASWANCDSGEPRVAFNDELRVVSNRGVEPRIIQVEKHAVYVAPFAKALPRADPIDFGLVLRTRRPSDDARLEDRALDRGLPAAETKRLRKWLADSYHYALKPIGGVVGTFGGGVDRIVVFAPSHARALGELDYDEEPERDVAVLLAGGEPKGVLPFGSVRGLEVVAAVDLDGDAIEELVWIYQSASQVGATRIAISYVHDGEFVTHEIAGCSYTGCNGFLPAERCGHSLIKPR